MLSRRRVGSGQAGSFLQSDELGLPLQSTLLSVLLQSGRVTLRGRNEPTAGPGEPEQVQGTRGNTELKTLGCCVGLMLYQN